MSFVRRPNVALLLSLFFIQSCSVSHQETLRVAGVLSEKAFASEDQYATFVITGKLFRSTTSRTILLTADIRSKDFKPFWCKGIIENARYDNQKVFKLECNNNRSGVMYLRSDKGDPSAGNGNFILSDGSTGLVSYGTDVYSGQPL